MIKCAFVPTEEGCRCTACGRTVIGHDGTDLLASCRPPCVYRSESKPAIKLPCPCVNGELIFVEVFACSEFKRCVPGYQPPAELWEQQEENKTHKLCHGCPKYTPTT